jgi:AAA domain, putative AbiEii toxin, Type IV TA system
LIDELDLHLHPVWQRKLREFLDTKLPNFQIIATTHSPLTAQQCGAGELFFLRRPDARAAPRLEPFPASPRELLVHQLLLSPQFGLETVDSYSVEELENEYPIDGFGVPRITTDSWRVELSEPRLNPPGDQAWTYFSSKSSRRINRR